MPIFRERKQIVQLFDPTTREEVIIDDKPYLLLFVLVGSDTTDEGEWMALRGRETVFQYLLQAFMNYDCLNSYVMSGNLGLGKEVSIYSFLRMLIEKYFPDQGLTVDELDEYVTDYANQDKEEGDKLMTSNDLQLFYYKEMNSPTK